MLRNTDKVLYFLFSLRLGKITFFLKMFCYLCSRVDPMDQRADPKNYQTYLYPIKQLLQTRALFKLKNTETTFLIVKQIQNFRYLQSHTVNLRSAIRFNKPKLRNLLTPNHSS